MPAYNCEAYIGEAVSSVIRQSLRNWELLIVNDRSTDSTPRIATAFAGNDDRIVLLDNAHDKGAGGARRSGIEHARGHYISFLDADDIWGADHLLIQNTHLQRGKAILHGNYHFADADGRPIHKVNAPESVSARKLLISNFMANSTVTYSVERCGKVYPSNIRSRNDYELWLRLLTDTGFASINVGDTGMVYRKTGRGLSSAGAVTNIARYVQVVSPYCGFRGAILRLPIYLSVQFAKRHLTSLYNNLATKI